jgi:hypothetical protein
MCVLTRLTGRMCNVQRDYPVSGRFTRVFLLPAYRASTVRSNLFKRDLSFHLSGKLFFCLFIHNFVLITMDKRSDALSGTALLCHLLTSRLKRCDCIDRRRAGTHLCVVVWYYSYLDAPDVRCISNWVGLQFEVDR